MSKDELAEKLGDAFGKARPFVERGEAIPTNIWSQVNQTVSGLCERVGISTPEQLAGKSGH